VRQTNSISVLAAVALAAPAVAEVRQAEPGGFVLAYKATIAAPPAKVWDALIEPGRWWNMDHSYSGDGANLTLDARAGGCFCEKVPKDGGSVEHMRVVQARPGSLLRLSGGLGPFQAMAVSGAMSWELKPAGRGTELSMSYAVGGYVPGGAQAIAPMVDQVLADQFRRLAEAAAK